MADNEIFDELIDEGTEETSLIAGGMDMADIKQFYKYVMGQTTTPPEVISRMMNDLINKLSMGLGYNVVNNIGRQADLSKFLAEAEKELFNPEKVASMTQDELKDAYNLARKELTSLQEFQRKFIVQNKDTIRSDSSKADKLMSKIMTLPADKIDEIMKLIEGGDTTADVPMISEDNSESTDSED